MLEKRGSWESLSNEILLSLCPYGGVGETQDGDSFFGSSRASYLAYWQAKYSRSLDFNDWVWVVEFEVIKSNVMQHL